jgi:hypothetical protein|tara:strand:+ start:2041 stop:2322 length:282 start_codon:yes stop_codon:yes gene_type:complete
MISSSSKRKRKEFNSHNDMIRQSVKGKDRQVGGDHYIDFKIMPIEYISKNKLDFLEGNVVKYISRHRKKNGAEDIRKVIHYAELILELEYGED